MNFGAPAIRGPIVVTGANGFIGRHLCESFARDGVSVRAITRSPSGFPHAGIENVFAADLLDRDALRAALAGASAVVHLAARVHSKPEGRRDPASECRRVNVNGTALLLAESVTAGVKSFVFASSVKAVASESETRLDADTPPQPMDAYGESKLEAERLLRVVARREGLHAPVLRLPVVYGPGMKANMELLFKAIAAGVPLPLAAIRNRRSFAYVGNAVGAIRALLDSPGAAQETFYVSDGRDLSTPELVRAIAHALDRPARLIAVPSTLLRGAGVAGGLLSRIAGLHLSTETITAVLGSLFVDISALHKTTGFHPPVTVENGMSLTAAWFHARKRETEC